MGAPPKAPIFYFIPKSNPSFAQCKKHFYGNFAQSLSIFYLNLLNAKSIFTHQSIATISPKRRDMPSACFQCADTLPIALKYTT